MNKDEILAKSRNENIGRPDEREAQILANASKVGMAVGGIFCVVIILFSRIIDVPLLGVSAWTVYFSMFGSSWLYHFLKTKEKARLVQAIIGIVFTLITFVGLLVMGLSK